MRVLVVELLGVVIRVALGLAERVVLGVAPKMRLVDNPLDGQGEHIVVQHDAAPQHHELEPVAHVVVGLQAKRTAVEREVEVATCGLGSLNLHR